MRNSKGRNRIDKTDGFAVLIGDDRVRKRYRNDPGVTIGRVMAIEDDRVLVRIGHVPQTYRLSAPE